MPKAKDHSLRPSPQLLRQAAAPLGPWVQTDEPLFWMAGAGIETRHKGYFFDCRKRNDPPHWVLQLTLSGEGYYERDGNGQRLKAGMALLDIIPGNFRYGYPPNGKEPYELVFLCPRGSMGADWCRRIARSFGHVLDFGPNNPVEPLMLAMARQPLNESDAGAFETGPREPRRRQAAVDAFDRYLVSARMYQLLMTMMSVLNRSRVKTVPLVSEAILIIEERADDPSFNVKSLAVQLACSREHLARCFQASLNVSPLDYLTQHRLRRAMDEMRNSPDKLDLIAQRCGFSGANYFCRVFRQHHGFTPALARRQPWLLG